MRPGRPPAFGVRDFPTLIEGISTSISTSGAGVGYADIVAVAVAGARLLLEACPTHLNHNPLLELGYKDTQVRHVQYLLRP